MSADDAPDLPAQPMGYYTSAQPPLGHDLEHTAADAFGGLFGCGTSMICLVFVIAILMVLLFFIAKWHLSFLKDISATLAALKEAINAKRD